MNSKVIAWIEGDRVAELTDWLQSGQAAGITGPEKDEWTRRAAAGGHAEILRVLAERAHGLDLERDEEGRTLLHYAAISGDRETMVFALTILGFSPFEGDKRGITPLDLAASRGPAALTALEELCGAKLADCYRNPVIRGFHPDPSIVRVGSDYYMVHSTFTWAPALPISHSRDLIHWETIGHVFTDPDTAQVAGLPGGYGYWAPDISFDGSRFWVVATLRRNDPPYRLQMITSAPAPEGPWDQPEFLPVDGIDPSLFIDDDGWKYMVINPGAQLVPLDEKGHLAGEPRMIYYGTNRHKSEGPHLLRKDGWYYLFQAEGGTGAGHMITCARSRNLWGPYEPCPFNPILGKKYEDAYIGRGGHGKPVMLADGRWAIPYLCGRKVEGRTMMGRETALDPLTWTADGWPMVNGLRGPSALQKKLLPDAPVQDREAWIGPRINPETFMREEEDSLVLQGGEPLNCLAGAHLAAHRQREDGFTQRVTADVGAMEEGGLAGLAGYYDERSYYLLALRKTGETAEIVLEEKEGEETRERVLGTLDGYQATLMAEGAGLSRTLRCPEAGVEIRIPVPYLTDEGVKGGKRFTGAALGIAAVGKGEAAFRGYEEIMA